MLWELKLKFKENIGGRFIEIFVDSVSESILIALTFNPLGFRNVGSSAIDPRNQATP